MKTCSKCYKVCDDSVNLCDECAHHFFFCSPKAERSEVLQGCPPSATGSADARASDEAGADSSGRSADEAVRAMVRYYIINADVNGLEETQCEDLPQALGIIQYVIFKGATNVALFVRTKASPTLTAQRERARQPNAKLTHSRD